MKALLPILLLTFGFSPGMIAQDQITLKALAPQGNQVNGREYIPLSNDLIRVELGYDCTLEENLLFDLVVTNEAGYPISLNPSAFYYLELDDPEGDSSRFPPHMAVPPLQPFRWHDRALEEPGFESMFSPFMEIPAMFLEAFFGPWAASPAGNTFPEQEWVSRMKDLVRQHMMQETELAPGETANGFVYFPGLPETKYLLFCFPLDDQEFQFAYELKNHRR